MALFPKIQSPCPYQRNLAAIMDGDFCRVCKRQVFDITDWSDDQRVAFLKSCSEKVCVSYRIKPALAAAALAAAAMAVPTAATAQGSVSEVVVITGGAIDSSNVEYIQDDSDADTATLPIVYENDGGDTPEED